MAADAPCGDQRDVHAHGREELAAGRNHLVKVKARVVQIRHACGTQMTTRQTGVFDHDGIGQSLLALPLAHQQLHASGIRQDRDEQGLGVLARQIRQIER